MSDAVIQSQPVFEIQRAAQRASFDFGWLRTSHSFSFADYYDPRNPIVAATQYELRGFRA